MVIESLLNPFSVKKRPWEVFFAGFFYSIVGLILSYFVFKEIAGILMVFLVVMAALPVVYSVIKNEEELDLKYSSESKLLKEHSKVLLFMIFLFLGITAAFVLCYIFLPINIVNSIFILQKKAILGVNTSVQGGAVQFNFLIKILMNNLKVLFFCVVFSLLYGTGAIFILTWNASVIATAMGNLIKMELAKTASLVGLPSIAGYFSVATFGFFRYMTHGLIEIAA